MGEDLRTRIAAAIYGVQKPWDGFQFAELSTPTQSLYQEQADAVIQALGLRIEYGALDHTDSGLLSDANDLTPLRGETIKTRYITDWHPHG